MATDSGRAPGDEHQRFDSYAAAYARFGDSTFEPILPWLSSRGVVLQGRAIDLGCGAGRHAEELGTAFDEVVGVDLSAPLIELARARPSLPPNVSFEVGDLTDYRDELGFDLVHSSTALHHVPDLEAALAHVRDLVRPGGWAVLRDVVRMTDDRLVWIWRHGGLFVGPLADAGRGLVRGGRHRRDAWPNLRFQLSPPWIRHLLADEWLTYAEFDRRYTAAFPGGRVVRDGLTTLIWRKPH